MVVAAAAKHCLCQVAWSRREPVGGSQQFYDIGKKCYVRITVLEMYSGYSFSVCIRAVAKYWLSYYEVELPLQRC